MKSTQIKTRKKKTVSCFPDQFNLPVITILCLMLLCTECFTQTNSLVWWPTASHPLQQCSHCSSFQLSPKHHFQHVFCPLWSVLEHVCMFDAHSNREQLFPRSCCWFFFFFVIRLFLFVCFKQGLSLLNKLSSMSVTNQSIKLRYNKDTKGNLTNLLLSLSCLSLL